MAVEVRYYTDPGCSWSWGAEPQLRRLAWEFDGELSFRWVMGGLARSYGKEYSDDEGGVAGETCFQDLVSHWLDVGVETGMPVDPRIWTKNPISSTYPACLAVKAASEQGEEAGGRYLRRVREGLMHERRRLDHADALLSVAGEAGLDLERFGRDVHSNAITEAFAADLDEVRDIPAEVREQGRVRRTEGRERVPFPSALFIGEDGARHGVWGAQPYAAYREAALAAGAAPGGAEDLDPVDAVLRLGRAATAEVALLSRRPDPVVLADLWTAARDWRLKPVPALTGTLWEAA
jgi:predicted DsbA family dithiol-disulfide isomerase